MAFWFGFCDESVAAAERILRFSRTSDCVLADKRTLLNILRVPED